MPPRRRPEGTVSATIFIPKDLHGRAMEYVQDVKQITRAYSLQQFLMIAVEQWLDDYDTHQKWLDNHDDHQKLLKP